MKIHKNIGKIDWLVRFILLLVFIYLSIEVSYWFLILVLGEIFMLITRWCLVYDLLGIDTLNENSRR